MERTIGYIDSEDFRSVSRKELLADLDFSSPRVAPPEDTPPYLASLYEFPLLTRDQEYHLFRKMNFLRYEAARLQSQLSLCHLNSRRVQQIERLLQEANDVRNWIVQCNLRLVVSIAKTLVDTSNSLDDLISDGNVPLMRAVEIFDFTRGLRFSTYATWAIRNGLYRSSKRNRRIHARFQLDDFNRVERDTVARQESNLEAWAQTGDELARLVDQLDPRSRTIVRDRFGLNGRDRPAKFREMAAKLRLSSERVRQLLDRALDRLRELAVDVQSP